MAVPIVAIIMVFGGIVAVFWVIFSTIRRLKVARVQSEVHSKRVLLDVKFHGPSIELFLTIGFGCPEAYQTPPII